MNTIRNYPGLHSVPVRSKDLPPVGGTEILSLADYIPIHFLKLNTSEKTIDLLFANTEIEGIFNKIVEKAKRSYQGYFELWDRSSPEEVITTGISQVLEEAIIKGNIMDGLNRQAYIDFQDGKRNKKFSITLELFFDRKNDSITIQNLEYIPY